MDHKKCRTVSLAKRTEDLPAHMQVGKAGEDLAVRYILSLQYEVRGRNVRFGHDEIDIVAYDPFDDVMVFVEVKTRSKIDTHYRPDLDITFSKKQKLKRSARAWIDQHEYDGGYRIDVLCIAHNTIQEHLKEIDWS